MSNAIGAVIAWGVVAVAAPPSATQPSAQSSVRAFSIEEAMTLAAERSEAVVSAGAQLDRAEAQRVQAWSAWLPQASGDVSYRRTLASEYDALLATASTGSVAGSPLAALPFGRKNTWNADITVHETLLDAGGMLAGIRGAAADVSSRSVAVDSARAQAVLAVVSAYDDAVLAQELLQIAQGTLTLAEETSKRTQLEFENGSRSEIEALRARVSLENQRPVVLAQANASALASLRLKQLLRLPLDEPVELTSHLDTRDLGDNAGAAVGADIATERVGVRQAQALVDMRKAALAAAWAAHFPTLGVDMSYGVVAYPDNVFPVADDLRNNWYVGGSLTIPIFTGFRTTAGVDAAAADLRDAEAQLRAARDAADLDARSLAQDIAHLRAAYDATAGVIDDADRALHLADLRYREGVGTFLDLNDARLQLEQAQANRSRAARDLQIALVERALLPLLPLTPAAAAVPPGGG